MSKSRTTVYSGPLQPKKKHELQEIADALGLSSVGSTKEDLLKLIKTHLEKNEPVYMTNPQYSGLYPRRKKTVIDQNQTSHATLVDETGSDDEPAREPTSSPLSRPVKPVSRQKVNPPTVNVTPESPARKTLSRLSEIPISPGLPNGARQLPVVPVVVPAPVPAAPISQEQPTEVAEQVVPEVVRVVEAVEQSSRQFRRDAEAMVAKTRTFLSNSANIATLTVLAELFTILYTIIPWNHLNIPVYNWPTLYIGYPPLSYLRTADLWVTIFFWSLPTLIIPQSLGMLISFTEPRREVNPLSAAIVRVACACAGSWTLDDNVLSTRWRVLSASMTLAFAFAEAVGENQKLTKVATVQSQE
jgi:hypothetical protein